MWTNPSTQNWSFLGRWKYRGGGRGEPWFFSHLAQDRIFFFFFSMTMLDSMRRWFGHESLGQNSTKFEALMRDVQKFASWDVQNCTRTDVCSRHIARHIAQDRKAYRSRKVGDGGDVFWSGRVLFSHWQFCLKVGDGVCVCLLDKTLPYSSYKSLHESIYPKLVGFG